RPADESYYIAFAALCLNHDSFQAGIDMINAGLERISGDPSLYIARGLLRAKLAQYDEAESDFNTAERLDSAQSLSSYALDLAELEKNHPGAALSHIRAQLKAHPDSALLHYLLAKLLFNQGLSTQSEAFGEAMSAALQAVKLNPNYTEARDLAADLYMRSGQYGAAIEQSRLALRADPSDRTATYHLIIALRHSGQKGQSGEIQALVKRLSDLQQASLRQEIERKRFRLVEGARPMKTSAGN
ncbi:MAG: tetratricopeptide repeat protein, partial [Terriglobia bacterium]